MDYLRIRFEDEAPAFGSGARAVLVVSLGPKWAKLLEPASCAIATLNRRDVRDGSRIVAGYDSLARHARELAYEPAKLAARLRRNGKIYGRTTAVLRDAIAALAEEAARR